MIRKEEILEIANETGLAPSVVEKDYVLGWVLAGIFERPNLKDSWIFKGGTCLKKCYFETYRFSEDLDFTLKEKGHLNSDFLLMEFTGVSEWLYERTGIEIPSDRLKFDIYRNPRGGVSCEGKVYYNSFFASGKRSWPKVKLDLTADELLVIAHVERTVIHSYSDRPQEGIRISSYAYEEVFGEKVRALSERGRPRDLYDVINLYRNDYLPSPPVLRDILKQKCGYKEIQFPTLERIHKHEPELARNWDPMLRHQLPQLPDLSLYWSALPEFFKWMNGKDRQQGSALRTISSEGENYRPGYGFLGLRTGMGDSLEIVRFAAGNRLCIDLDYTDEKGKRSTRRIEPYSLRRAKTGNVLLYAVRSEDEEIRAYKVNRINSVSLANQEFIPRYEVELSPQNPVNASMRTGDETHLGLPGSGKFHVLRTSKKRS